MFHPNIYNNGELCLDILQNRWSPTYDVAAILTSVQSLLNDPNPSSPANVEAASLFKDNKQEYERRVKVGRTTGAKRHVVVLGVEYHACRSAWRPVEYRMRTCRFAPCPLSNALC